MSIALERTANRSTLAWAVVANILAWGGVAGSLWLTLSMDLKACPLCLYQRSMMMAAAAVLLLGLFTELRRSPALLALALAPATAGLGVAGFHEYLVVNGTLECPPGIAGLGTTTQQSLAAFLVLFALLFAAQFRRTPLLTAASLLLGVLLAVGMLRTAPPLPDPPPQAYDKPLDGCRPPFRPRS
jgi:disulfide bond formation protein DsbB